MSSRICKFYRLGKCQNGQSCKFRHVENLSPEKLKQTVECRHWKKTGNCKLGDSCKYGHFERDSEDEEESEEYTTSSSEENVENEVVVCRYWKRLGKCRLGQKCKFAHSVTGSDPIEEFGSEEKENANDEKKKAIVCKHWKKHGNCRLGQKCKFFHPPAEPVEEESDNDDEEEEEEEEEEETTDAVKKVVVCKHWKKHGNCRLGQKCKFVHTGQEQVAADDEEVDSEDEDETEETTKVVCKHWKKHGNCRLGQKCKFVHTNQESSKNAEEPIVEEEEEGDDEKKKKETVKKVIVCKHWKKHGNCRLGKKCKFSHPPAKPVEKKSDDQEGEDDINETNVPEKVEPKKKICRYWKKLGKCRLGQKCKFAHPGQVQVEATLPSVIISERCYARIGLVGNPSDGFYGKTLSMALGNYSAVVSLSPSDELKLVCHQFHDKLTYNSLAQHRNHIRLNGYYGGMRLLQATLTMFHDRCALAKINPRRLSANFTLKYETDIPRMVGLSGSSAIVLACWKALMRFYNIELEELNLTQETLPQLILDIEEQELDIRAGLQDRVIQVYGGLVHMDFNKSVMSSQGHGNYTSLDPTVLPPLYLIYDLKNGTDSGKAHNDVRQRFTNGDEAVIGGMAEIADLADEAVLCLLNNNVDKLPSIMKQNFDIRRSMYGDACTGERNIEMIDLANQLGLTGKFTGSGGAAVCIVNQSASSSSAASSSTPVAAVAIEKNSDSFFSNNNEELQNNNLDSLNDDKNKNNLNRFLLSKDDEKKISKKFHEAGFEFVKVFLPPPSPSSSS
jgi:glucuronokinase